MEVLALNASPLMEKGNTAITLEPFLNGMKDEGCHVDLLYTSRLHVKPCLGERGCWMKTPGRCVQNDDLRTLLPKIQQADFIVFATPVYVDGMPGALKNIIDRLLPIIEPYFVMEEGHCRHPPREPHKRSKVALVSNCGFWEMDNFDPLLMHMKAICKNASWDYCGALLRPHAEALTYMVRRGIPFQDVLEAAENLGREVVKTGTMSLRNLEIVSRELVSLETYVEMTNKGFRQVLDRLAFKRSI